MANPWLTFFKQLLLGKETKTPLMFNIRMGLIYTALFSIFLLSPMNAEKVKVFYWIMVFIAVHLLIMNAFAFCKPTHLTHSAKSHLEAAKAASLGSEKGKLEPGQAEAQTATPSGSLPAHGSEEEV